MIRSIFAFTGTLLAFSVNGLYSLTINEALGGPEINWFNGPEGFEWTAQSSGRDGAAIYSAAVGPLDSAHNVSYLIGQVHGPASVSFYWREDGAGSLHLYTGTGSGQDIQYTHYETCESAEWTKVTLEFTSESLWLAWQYEGAEEGNTNAYAGSIDSFVVTGIADSDPYFPSSIPNGDGSLTSDWYGRFWPLNDGYYYHDFHGWLYLMGGGDEDTGIWFYDLGLSDYCFMQAHAYPYLYTTKYGWVYFNEGYVDEATRWFYALESNTWIQVYK